MEAIDHLFQDLRSVHPELAMCQDDFDEDRCLEIQLGQTRFVLSVLREWRAGLLVHAPLGQPTDAAQLMREALQLNSGHTTRHEPIYALQGERLVCRYRLLHTDAHAATLIERLQRVAEQQQAWVEAGWLRPLEEEVCA